MQNFFKNQSEDKKERTLNGPEAGVPTVSGQDPYIHQFWDQDEIKGKKQEAEKQGVSIGTAGAYLPAQGKGFNQRFCIPEQEHDVENFLREVSLKDKLVFIPDGKIIGKGIRNTIRECKIFIQQDGEIYTYHLDNSDETEPFNVIPQDVIFIIIDDADQVFIAAGAEGETASVYSLSEDVTMAVFIETKAYHRLNHFYAYAVKNTAQNYCICDVSANPRAGKGMFRLFATAIESDLERNGLGQ